MKTYKIRHNLYSFVKIFVLAIIVSSCSGYKSENALGYGFSEQKVNDNSYIVSYRANMFTTKSRTQEFLELRAAELTLQNGFKYFTLNSTDASYNSSSITMYKMGTSVYGDVHDTSVPEFVSTVVMYNEKPEYNASSYELYYDAAQSVKNLKEKYNL